MSLSLNARRAERFAELLESGDRTDDLALAPFGGLAAALRAVPALAGPAPEFQSALRRRLVAVATVQAIDAPPASATARLREVGATWKFQRRMAVLAGGAAAATAIAGVGLGASRSLPGDPFYGVKRATEDAQLAATFGQEAKGKRHLEFARVRLAEIESLAGRSAALGGMPAGGLGALGTLSDGARTSTILATLRDMDAETRAGANDLFAVYRDSGSAEPLHALDSFTRKQFAQLSAVLPTLPVAARGRAASSLSLLSIIASHTVSLAGIQPAPSGSGQPGGGSGPGSTTPTPAGSNSGGASSSTTPGTGNGGGQPTGTTGPNPGPSVPSLPTDVPTIPVLPTTVPTPTKVPTTLPTLPPLPSLSPVPSLPPTPTLPPLPGLGH
jgi:hypothetical protein